MSDLKAARAVLDVLVDQSTRAERALSPVLANLEKEDPALALAVAAQVRAMRSCAEEMAKLITHLRTQS